jgi:hypothetical protein
MIGAGLVLGGWVGILVVVVLVLVGIYVIRHL